MSGVSYYVSCTDKYLISSGCNLDTGAAMVNIRDSTTRDYIGTLDTDKDFGSIRCLYAMELEKQLIVIAASDECILIWKEDKNGIRLKALNQVFKDFKNFRLSFL